MKSVFLNNIDEQIALLQTLNTLDSLVHKAAILSVVSLMDGGKLMFCGNGGSAADSQHLASEFTGRFLKERRPIAALALTTDTSALTCISNDYAFKEVFARQVQALGKRGDVLFAISTSGNSSNVIRAVEEAHANSISVIGLLGNGGGALKEMCDIAIVVPCHVTARIQETHILIGHTLCEMIENLEVV